MALGSPFELGYRKLMPAFHTYSAGRECLLQIKTGRSTENLSVLSDAAALNIGIYQRKDYRLNKDCSAADRAARSHQSMSGRGLEPMFAFTSEAWSLHGCWLAFDPKAGCPDI